MQPLINDQKRSLRRKRLKRELQTTSQAEAFEEKWLVRLTVECIEFASQTNAWEMHWCQQKNRLQPTTTVARRSNQAASQGF